MVVKSRSSSRQVNWH
ncbi:UNVERIFIED_CONTAM: hypothetical protein GTU68_008556 [Idotea baltica]|nr:hypothetical protein [Idotea baltica]